jgi:hypothetical protein
MVAIACQRQVPATSNPLNPSGSGDGKLTAQATPSPPVFPSQAPVPTAPSNAPIPTNPSPGQVPTAPSPGQVPTSPTTSPLPGNPAPGGGPGPTPPTGPGGNPGGGGGGGGGGAGNCPAKVTVKLDNPLTLQPTTAVTPEIQTTEQFSVDCIIEAVKVSIRITAPDIGAALPPGFNISMAYRTGQVLQRTGLVRVNNPLVGVQLGEDCGTKATKFEEGGVDFDTAVPPYNATYKPLGGIVAPSNPGTFDAFEGLFAGSRWELTLNGFAAPIVIQCWTVELTLQRKPPTPILQEPSAP